MTTANSIRRIFGSGFDLLLSLSLISSLIFGLFFWIYFSTVKIDFWFYNDAQKPIQIKGCYFEGKKLEGCPTELLPTHDRLSAILSVKPNFSLDWKKTYTLDLEFLIDNNLVKDNIKFQGKGGFCIEWIRISEQGINAAPRCENGFE